MAVTAQPQRIPALDGVRGLAVMMVFVYHYGGGQHAGAWWMRAIGTVTQAGWAGVSLFFVLSGFLITGKLWDARRDPQRARDFYWRRMLRIFPLYYLALALVLMGAAAWGTLGSVLHSIWIPALFLQNMPVLVSRVQEIQSPMLLHHFWSLAVEEQFYLLWPWLVWRQTSRQRVMAWSLLAFVAATVFRCWATHEGWNAGQWLDSLPARMGDLAAGAWLAMAMRGGMKASLHRWAAWTLAVSLVAFAVVCWKSGGPQITSGWQMSVGIVAVTGMCAALLALSVTDATCGRIFSVAWLRWVGTISYGMYVFHILLRVMFWHVTHLFAPVSAGIRYFAVRFVVAAVGTVAVSWVSYVVFESRFLRLKSRVLRRESTLART